MRQTVLTYLLSMSGVSHVVCGFRRRTAPTGRAGVRVAAVRFVVGWVSDHLVCDVLLLAEEFLQSDYGDQQEGELADEESFTHEQGEHLERQNFEHTHFHHHGGHHWSHVLVLTTACNATQTISDRYFFGQHT